MTAESTESVGRNTTAIRNAFVIGAAVLVLAASNLLPAANLDNGPPRHRPNIVFVMFDDATKDDVEHLPNIRRLIADQGASFDNFYATEPICCPARATILTGDYVHNHGVESAAGSDGGYDTFRTRGHEARSLARMFHERNYQTGLFGKYLNLYGPATNSADHVPDFWDRWLAAFTHQKYDYQVNSNGKVLDHGNKNKDFVDSVITRAAQRWIERASSKDRGVFAHVSVISPHAPYSRTPGYRDAYKNSHPPSFDKPSYNEQSVSDKPGYVSSQSSITPEQRQAIGKRYRQRQRMMRTTDDFVRKLVRGLDAAGELDRTYIFVTSDNGWMQGEHRIPDDKLYPYEESVHMPLLVRGPGIAPGSTIPELASMVDLFATFSDLAGGSIVERDGRSLVPLLEGRAVQWRTQVLIENLRGSPSAAAVPGITGQYFGVVTQRYKYVEYMNGEVELYDLASDPFETDSLHETASRALIDTLKAKLDALKSCRGDSCRTADSS